ncbi:MAG TPA: DUF4129 domain-containing protein [Chloroflexia bacterium]|nr:DUF4129 domain-containing protein [Chloroflexia bacterium]
MTIPSIRTIQSQFALPICLVGMDACWVYTVAWLFSSIVLSPVTAFPVPGALLLGLLEFAGWLLASYLIDNTNTSQTGIRAIMAASGFVVSLAIGLVLTPFTGTYSLVSLLVWLYIIIISVSVWMLGGYRASERAGFADVYATFRFGLVAIAAAALLSTLLAFGRVNDLWGELGGVALWFFAFSLVGLALGNRDAIRRESGDGGVRSWGWLLVVTVGLILLLGTVGQAFGSGGVIAALQQAITAVVGVVAFVLYGIAYLMIWPLTLFNIDLGPMGPPSGQQSPPSSGSAEEALRRRQPELFEDIGPANIPIELQSLFMGLASALVVATLLYFLVLWLRRTRREIPHPDGEDRESFGSFDLLVAQIKEFFARLLARFRPQETALAGAGEDDMTELWSKPEFSGTLTVRQMYARLLLLAGRAGYPRRPQQTPTEYMRVLTSALPSLQGELADITSAYIEARYGSKPASSGAVQAAATAWRRAEPVLVSEVSRQQHG